MKERVKVHFSVALIAGSVKPCIVLVFVLPALWPGDLDFSCSSDKLEQCNIQQQSLLSVPSLANNCMGESFQDYC